MACTWDAFLVADDQKYARQAAAAAFAEIDRLEQELSRFVPHSDIARINRLHVGQSVLVGVEVLECLELAARYHRETGGAFDVTIGALLGDSGTTADASVGMQFLDINRAQRAVAVRAEGLVVDLGALGKGYAVDRAIDVLRDWGITAALVHSGQSTAYALGAPPEQTGWTIAVRNPLDHAAELGRVCLCDAALGGSGVLLHGGHIIDPRTRRPVAGATGAWALTSTTVAADALSTAFMVLTPAEVAQYCRDHPDVSGLLFIERAEGSPLRAYGRGFRALASPTRTG